MAGHISKHDLVPVPLAARMVYERAYGASPPAAHLTDRLNGLAYWLARLGTMYAMDEGNCAPRRLSPRDLSSGHFRHGGGELHFLDDRSPITDIAVTQDCIEKAVNALLLENQAASR
jgi:hypothetical protein